MAGPCTYCKPCGGVAVYLICRVISFNIPEYNARDYC